jgi:hypothetical protein
MPGFPIPVEELGEKYNMCHNECLRQKPSYKMTPINPETLDGTSYGRGVCRARTTSHANFDKANTAYGCIKIPCLFGFLVVVASLVCSGLHSVVLWDVWPVLLGICAWRLSGSLPGVSHHCLSILQIAWCFSPGAPPRRQLLRWPCGLPVSCPGVSRLASRGLSLHDLVL